MKGEAAIVFAALDAYGRPGGLQQFNRRIIRCLDEGPALARVFLLRGEGATEPSSRVETFSGDRMRFSLSTLRAARHAEILLLGHLNLAPLALAAKRINPRLRTVLFAHGHEFARVRSRARHAAERLSLKGVDSVFCVSRHTAATVAAQFGHRSTAILGNALDALPAPAPQPPAGPLRLLCVSRMEAHDRGKNIALLLRALCLLDAGISLTMVGDGVLRAEFARLAQALGVADRVDFVGAASPDTLDRAYRSANMFVLPSEKEGFGIVFLEAMAYGLPVICLASGGAAEVVEDGATGLCLPAPATPDTLSAAIHALAAAPDRRVAMGRAGRNRVEAAFLHDAFRARFSSLLEGAA